MAIAAGGGNSSHGGSTCAVAATGELYCWGNNSSGQLGDSTTTAISSPKKVLGVGGAGFLTNVTKVSMGGSGSYAHTCALTAGGAAYCWGYNTHGQLGDNTTTARSTPVQVRGVGGTGFLSNVIDISASGNSYSTVSYNHTCAATSSGAAYCWGYNANGQLGINNTTQQPAPVQVLGVGGTGTLANVVQVSTAVSSNSQGFSCAVTSLGTAFCWGHNGQGRLGDATTTQRNTPVQVVSTSGSGTLTGITKISAGSHLSGYASTCAISSSGLGYCWGYLNGGTQNSWTTLEYPKLVLDSAGTGNLNNLINIAVAPSGFGTTYGRACAVNNQGEIFCWGERDTGAIGDGRTDATAQYLPVKVWAPGAVGYTQIATSGRHSCGLQAGSVYCWGTNSNGQLGDGTTANRTFPTRVLGVGGIGFLSNIIQVSTGSGNSSEYLRTCAVSASGLVYCWGHNNSGQLGDGTTTTRTTPVQVTGLSNVVKVSVGSGYNTSTCAVTSDGAAYCWGYGGHGQLGNGGGTNSSVPVRVSGVGGSGFLTGVIDIAASSQNSGSGWASHVCAVTSVGYVYCWGNNSAGQLGDGTATARSTPVQVAGLTGVVQVATTSYYDGGGYIDTSYIGGSCALSSAGSVSCWGANNTGGGYNLGSGGIGTAYSTPQPVASLTGVTRIVAGAHSYYANYCALKNDGVYCWGSGFGNAASLSLSNSVAGSNFQGIALGEDYQYCGLSSSGSMYCGGSASATISMGVGTNLPVSGIQQASVPVPSGLSIASIAAGQNHSCAVANGSGYCWGAGTNGALGNNSNSTVLTTSNVQNASGGIAVGLSQISAGGTQTCSMTSTGGVKCWGDNFYGDLGNNSTTQSMRAVDVVGPGGAGLLSSTTSLSSGYRHNCSVGASGQVYCWGWNAAGQLGTNSTISAATPTAVVGVGGTGNLTGMSRVVSGYAHNCALSSGGEVYCWGRNDYGQLGVNSTTNSKTPVRVLNVAGSGGLSGVTALAAGAYHTCAVAGGQVYCWGRNDKGQLGDDTSLTALYPTGTLNAGLVGLTGITSITAGAEHTCAVTTSGTVMCWGGASYGQLGNGGYVDSRVATEVSGVGGTGQLSAIASVSAGAVGYHTCALNATGVAVYCWGSGSSGQMGNNTTPSAQTTPVAAIVATVGVTYFSAR